MRNVYITYDNIYTDANDTDVIIKMNEKMNVLDCVKIALRMRPNNVIIKVREDAKNEK